VYHPIILGFQHQLELTQGWSRKKLRRQYLVDVGAFGGHRCTVEQLHGVVTSDAYQSGTQSRNRAMIELKRKKCTDLDGNRNAAFTVHSNVTMLCDERKQFALWGQTWLSVPGEQMPILPDRFHISSQVSFQCKSRTQLTSGTNDPSVRLRDTTHENRYKHEYCGHR